MSYFTCEVHNLQFSSIQALKEHVTKFHLEENPSPSQSSLKRSSITKNKVVAVSPNRKKDKNITELLKKRITISSSTKILPSRNTDISHTRSEKVKTPVSTNSGLLESSPEEQKIQCHICGEFFSSLTHSDHLQTHFFDNLLPSSGKVVVVKTEMDEVPTESSNAAGESSEDDNINSDPDFCPAEEDITGSTNVMNGESSNTILPRKIVGKLPKNVCTHPGCTRTKPFKNECHLRDHLRIHTGENKPFHCSWKGCDRKFKRCNELELHYRSHTGEKPSNNVNHSRCRCCAKNEKHLIDYKPHLPTGKLVCYFCGYVPKNLLQDFDRHMSTHTLERPYRCKICNRLCHNDEGVKQHAKVHTADDISERCHKCKDCGSSFKDGSSLRKHRTTHSTFRPYSCSACLKSYKRYADLRRHILTVHSTSKAYKCHICPGNRVFARRDYFKFHITKSHPEIEFAEPEPQFQREKNLSNHYMITCNLCKIYFKNNLKFTQHRRKCSGTIKPEKIKTRKLKQQKLESTKDSQNLSNVETSTDNLDSPEKVEPIITKLKCQICDGRIFNSENCLKLHMQVFHDLQET